MSSQEEFDENHLYVLQPDQVKLTRLPVSHMVTCMLKVYILETAEEMYVWIGDRSTLVVRQVEPSRAMLKFIRQEHKEFAIQCIGDLQKFENACEKVVVVNHGQVGQSNDLILFFWS